MRVDYHVRRSGGLRVSIRVGVLVKEPPVQVRCRIARAVNHRFVRIEVVAGRPFLRGRLRRRTAIPVLKKHREELQRQFLLAAVDVVNKRAGLWGCIVTGWAPFGADVDQDPALSPWVVRAQVDPLAGLILS
jgi:hypothetical protein